MNDAPGKSLRVLAKATIRSAERLGQQSWLLRWLEHANAVCAMHASPICTAHHYAQVFSVLRKLLRLAAWHQPTHPRAGCNRRSLPCHFEVATVSIRSLTTKGRQRAYIVYSGVGSHVQRELCGIEGL